MVRAIYIVAWTEKARLEYGVPLSQCVVSVEPKDDIAVNVSKSKIGRPKYRYADALAIFYERREAKAFVSGNKDWVIMKSLITII